MERTNYPDGVDPEDVDSVMQAWGAPFLPPVLTEAHENVGRVTELSLLLTAIERAMPRPAVIFIEGTRLSDEVKTYLEERSLPSGRDDLWGTLWPRPSGFHIPVTDENLIDLRQLVSRHARPEDPYPFGEICDHVVVYCDDLVLLGAYDVGSDVWLSRELPTATVELFREAAGAVSPGNRQSS